MRAVITVVGRDMVGILARVSCICAENNVNILEVSQSILQDMFCMIMIADIGRSEHGLSTLAESLEKSGKELGLVIHCMHEDVFNSMHKI